MASARLYQSVSMIWTVVSGRRSVDNDDVSTLLKYREKRESEKGRLASRFSAAEDRIATIPRLWAERAAGPWRLPLALAQRGAWNRIRRRTCRCRRSEAKDAGAPSGFVHEGLSQSFQHIGAEWISVADAADKIIGTEID